MDLSVDNVINSLKEVLVGWINTVLYYHQVYPPYIFEPYNSFDVIVHKSRSQTLNQYVDRFMDEFLELLVNSNQIDELSVILYSKQTVYYKYAIKFNEFIKLGDKIQDNSGSIIKYANNEVNWSQIFIQFKSFLFYHVQSLMKIPPTNVDLEFKMLVNSNLDLVGNHKWVSTQAQLLPDLNHISLSRFKPLQEVSVGFIRFSSYYQYEP